MIIASLIIIGLIIYLIFDFKKKFFIFRNKEEKEEFKLPIEESEKTEKPKSTVRRHSIKNKKNSVIDLNN